MLELLEGDAFRFRVEEEDDEELQDHHGGEEAEGACLRSWLATKGKTTEMMAFMIQCELEPRLWPLERTWVGKTSLM